MTVLVAIEAGGRTAGVVVEEGLTRLTPEVGGEPWSDQIVSDHGPVFAERDRTWLAGGVLLPGAVAVRVSDAAGRHHAATIGDGAWIAELAGPVEAVACQLDAAGAPVAPQLPASWQREPVSDAVEPCPACGSVGWEQITADDGSHGQRGFDSEALTDVPFVACSACGHEEGSLGGWWWAPVEPEAAEPSAAEQLEFHQQLEAEQRAALVNVAIPVFVPVDMEVTLTGWGGREGEPVDRVTVTHDDVRGTSSIEVLSQRGEASHDPLVVAVDKLSDLWHSPEAPPQRSVAAQVVWQAAHRRAQIRALAEMPTEVGTRSLRVDGERAPFAVAHGGDRWVAIGAVGDMLVMVTAFGVEFDDVELRTLSDPLHLVPAPADEPPAER